MNDTFVELRHRLYSALLTMFILHNLSMAAPVWFNKLNTAADCYVQGYGTGSTPEEAAEKAWSSVIRHTGGASTASVSSSIIDSQGRNNGVKIDYSVITSQAEGSIAAVGDKLYTVLGNVQDKEISGAYNHYLLVCMKDSPCACRLDYPSNTVAALRSSLIPGLGHIYKGRTRRGIGYLGTTAVMAAGGSISLGISNGFFRDASNSRTVEANSYYRSRGNMLYWGGIAALVAAGGVYLWNIFDARNCEGIPQFR